MSIVTMKVWMVVFVLGQVVANVYLRKVQADCVLKVEEHTSRINADAMTTVVGEGPEIDLESANVESVLHRFRRNEEEEALGPFSTFSLACSGKFLLPLNSQPFFNLLSSMMGHLNKLSGVMYTHSWQCSRRVK